MTEDLTEDLARLAAHAAAGTAQDLARAGFVDAWSDGPNVYARKGHYLFIMRNQVEKGAPGNREKMLDLFAAMVVQALVRREENPEVTARSPL